MNPEKIYALNVKTPDEMLSVKVQSLSKDKTKAMLVLYLSHADAANLLDRAQVSWEWKILERIVLTPEGRDPIVVMKGVLTVEGVSRENYGEGPDEKSAASDVFKRCAMLFGVGRDLYGSEQIWINYDERNDKYRHFTLAEYRAAGKPNPPSLAPATKPLPVVPRVETRPAAPPPVLAPILPRPTPLVQERLDLDKPIPSPKPLTPQESPASIEERSGVPGYILPSGAKTALYNEFAGTELSTISQSELHDYFEAMKADLAKKKILPENVVGVPREVYWAIVAEIDRRNQAFLESDVP